MAKAKITVTLRLGKSSDVNCTAQVSRKGSKIVLTASSGNQRVKAVGLSFSEKDAMRLIKEMFGELVPDDSPVTADPLR